ncbi:TPA: Nif3-like dinuclear metal center hexameric protein [Legionella pneumophila]|uniref:Nif3-like dinuclear metal center hexameric protein n=1 Tax=Legionella pneumophila TaxID=446 RepID=UPI0004890DB6|nr:Nif3-like dinuclear metal center hexameric protein [Legionella pneumophila]MCK1857199.1 Nif3-like dinuclear metal center hexameric protein [Legionella pneumophila]MCK1870438.1 Nif3-like dinuclear metal center hexameric protein [Legionella pneumophila]MCZ4723791.1 Nif3-like dinuclear metal center hexameric protein [Legionella pneumophila]MCZ4728719.1 Nif3-like dinuclear metal center hexameric protein [Legionella pneumophila]MDI2080293.1 Nif3-like dinuclear metal center hexameric protein [Leg
MITRDELSLFLLDFLNCSQYQDYAPNGIQVEGKDKIKRICTAVSASEDVISQAIEQQADALLVHHGYFWKGENPVISGMKRRRIAKLLGHNMNLFAYHLPLDCHPELGNNASLANLLLIESHEMHKVNNTPNLLWSGKLSKAMNSEQFSSFLEHKLGRYPVHIAGNEKMIHSIAWCTGAAQDFIEEAYQLGVDAYLSGEVSERTFYQAMELGIQYFSCGHHATERFGIQSLGVYLANYFDLEHWFIDSPNPI